MSGKSVNFDDKKIKRSNFYKNKNEVLVSKKESYGKKNSLIYFIGYNNDDGFIRPLFIKLKKLIKLKL